MRRRGETFARFEIMEIETTWTLASATAGAQRVTELIITGGS